ncbi:MAG: PEP-CTERM sorting domain-containing protein [Verrucomicrobiae bacterium]|nr:PEP-CTERM sorting domain-containing protein [Verrucomicrobiae bacterium]
MMSFRSMGRRARGPSRVRAWAVGAGCWGLLTASLCAQSTTNLWLGGSAAWDTAAKWSLGVAPSATDALWITNTASSYTVSLGAGTDPSTLTNRGLVLGLVGVTATTQTLSLVSAPAPVAQNLGVQVNQSGLLSIQDSTLTISSNLTLNRGRVEMSGSGAKLEIVGTPFGYNALVLRGETVSARMTLSGGALVATNATGNAWTQIGSGLGNRDRGMLLVSNTLLHLDQVALAVYADDVGFMSIQNAGLAETNRIRGFHLGVGTTPATGGVEMVGGTIFSSDPSYLGGNVSYGVITNRGATWIVHNNIDLGSSASGFGELVVQGGTNSLVNTGGNTGRLLVGSFNEATGALKVVGGWIVSDNAIRIGVNGVGFYEQSGGMVAATNASATGVVRVGDGAASYTQSGGKLVADTLTLFTNTSAFSVGSLGTVEVRGAAGVTNAVLAANAGAFAFDGALKFAPASASVLTQSLLWAGLDLGAAFSGFSNNFAIGALDLSGFSSSNRLVLGAFASQSSTALYVRTISALATNALISDFTVYYDSALNPDLAQQTYSLNGGGFLAPVAIPEPGSLVLLALGAIALRRRRRSS